MVPIVQMFENANLSQEELLDILFYCPYDLKKNIASQNVVFQSSDEKFQEKVFGKYDDFLKIVTKIQLEKVFEP